MSAAPAVDETTALLADGKNNQTAVTRPPQPPPQHAHAHAHGHGHGHGGGGDRYRRKRRWEERVRKTLHVWSPYSPYFRFFILGLAVLIPFGPHMVKYCLTPIASLMIHDPSLGLTHTQFGTFMAAVSIPNLVLPFVGGVFLDLRGSRTGVVLLLSWALVGHAIFVGAITYHSYVAALIGRVIFGLGQGSSVVAQGRIAAHWFVGRELTFAIGISESVHSISGWLAKLPVSEWTGSYRAALWVGLISCGVSLVAGLMFFVVERKAERINRSHENRSQHSIARAARHRQQQERLSAAAVATLSRQGSVAALPPEVVSSTPAPPPPLLAPIVSPRSGSVAVPVSAAKFDPRSATPDSLRAGRSSAPLIHSPAIPGSVDGNRSSPASSVTVRTVALNADTPQPPPPAVVVDLTVSTSSLGSSTSATAAADPVATEPASARIPRPFFPPASHLPHISRGDLRYFECKFWLLLACHLFFSNVFHLFSYVSADFLSDKYGLSVSTAAWFSSVLNVSAIFLTPVAGVVVDRTGYRMYLSAIGAALSAAAFVLFIWTHVNPLIPLFLLSVNQCFIPTLLRASVPLLICSAYYGTAYGLYEVAEAAGALFGHPFVGWVRDTTGSYEANLRIFLGMAVLACLSSLAVAWLDTDGVLLRPTLHSGTTPRADTETTDKVVSPIAANSRAESRPKATTIA